MSSRPTEPTSSPGSDASERQPHRIPEEPRPGSTRAGPAGAVSPVEQPQLPSRPAIWLLDGFNVLHAALFTSRDRSSSWWTEEHRERLIARVCGFTESAEEIWVAFDGARTSERDARTLRTSTGVPVYLAFASSADDWLVRRVRRSGEPERIAVVTRDRRVGRPGSCCSGV